MIDIWYCFSWGTGYKFYLQVKLGESLQVHNLVAKYFPGYFRQHATNIMPADARPLTYTDLQAWCSTLPVPEVKTISKYNFIARAIHSWKNRY
jgi:hypothetical protein